MATSKTLSLVKRESFFDDSFFTDAWEDFDTAVQSILDKFDNTGLKVDVGSRTQCRDLYSKIRSSKIDEDLYASQALQITEKDGKFQAVMDVKDFSPNDLQVRVVDDRVVVEGKYFKKSEDGSSTSSKSFYKEFTMPQTANIDEVATALSKDGVLTVKAPKREGDASKPAGALSSSVQQQSSSAVQESSSSVSSSSVKKVSMSSSSTFSSSSKSSFSANNKSSLDDMSKDMKDRLVFSHDNVNLKLPGGQ
ncbi:protein lethal(2)essential for life-like [Homarus americanus]|uniref:Lethal(2)essential for life-like 3 n=1 Tax=Homarus americanus TaxID=6706 RepID=A0A8J5JTD2_HOMAM|nr:protein lethal(2)essential for life-like [Homarus americanus]KAG7160679.1 lethal(2)essential for life-like 3 [Homarus americanus]